VYLTTKSIWQADNTDVANEFDISFRRLWNKFGSEGQGQSHIL